MRAERSALVFRRRNKPRHMQIAIVRRFRRKLCVISLLFEIFRRFKALFNEICVQNVVRVSYVVETSPDTGKTHSFVDFDENYAYFSPVRDISTFSRTLHCVMRAERSTRIFHRRNKSRHT